MFSRFGFARIGSSLTDSVLVPDDRSTGPGIRYPGACSRRSPSALWGPYTRQMQEPSVTISLDLTPREAAFLTVATCEFYHHMKATETDEIYGALIMDDRVLAAREVWRKVEAVTKVGEWD